MLPKSNAQNKVHLEKYDFCSLFLSTGNQVFHFFIYFGLFEKVKQIHMFSNPS